MFVEVRFDSAAAADPSLFSCYSVAKPRSPTATTFHNPPSSFILLRFLSFHLFILKNCVNLPSSSPHTFLSGSFSVRELQVPSSAL